MDDRRAGLVVRGLRRRRAWRQADLAAAAGVSQTTISRLERGHLDSLSLMTVRSVLAAVDARVELDVRWRGGELDRVVDARHTALAGEAARVLGDAGWTVLQEVTFSVYGERGSIDLVGVHEAARAAIAMEVKTELVTWEETQRRLDVKVRLLPKILFERLGWRPLIVGRVLILEESMVNRRRVGAVGVAAELAYPARGRDIRRWLRAPTQPISGIWFLSVSHPRTGRQAGGGFHRVRRPEAAPSEHGMSVRRAAQPSPRTPWGPHLRPTSPEMTE
jgi:transcriptional regulator with XRE-family HTH domain